jgi:hypothetical protein
MANTIQQTYVSPGTGNTRKVTVSITRTADIGSPEWQLMEDIAADVRAYFEVTKGKVPAGAQGDGNGG